MDDENIKHPNPRKRKSSQISKNNAAYRNLLNTTIHEISHPTTEGSKQLPPSQVGLTKWTSQEKALFLSALERLGKHDISGIAERIGGGKSPLEVREYILLLEQGVEESKSAIGIGEIPAAMEISIECCEALEEVAGMVEAEQRGVEEKMEREEWGEEWLVDWEVAANLEDMVSSRSRPHIQDEEGRKGRKGREDELLEAAELLKPATFLSLSTHFFMNTSSPLSDNWQSLIPQNQNSAIETQIRNSTTVADDGEEIFPSMRATAFTDFYNLVVQLTSRIVSTTIFCAESRLRTTGLVGGRGKRRLVKQRDVRAALEMLGLGIGGRDEEWWDSVVRRCGVVVLGEEGGEEMRNGEGLESLANQPGEIEGGGIASTDEDEDDGDSIHDEGEDGLEDVILPTVKSRRRYRETGQESDSDSEFENLNDSSDHTPQQSPSPSSQVSNTSPSHSQKQSAYISALDTHTSHQEESRLWTLLNRDPPAHLHLLHSQKAPKRPRDGRTRVKSDDGGGRNWSEKGRMEYWSSWEVMEMPVGEEEFRDVERRKRRRGEERSGSEGKGERRGEDGVMAGSHGISDERVRDSDLENDDPEEEDEMEADTMERDETEKDIIVEDNDQGEGDEMERGETEEDMIVEDNDQEVGDEIEEDE